MSTTSRLWFALIAPIVGFGVAGAFGWWIGTYTCTSVSVGAARLSAGIVTLAMLAVAAVSLQMGIGNYREAAAAAEASADRVEFMALAGVMVSGSLAVGLIWFALNAVFINACGWMR